MTATQPGLVGRDQPLAELQALVAAALASRGGLVTLTGEAGIGKTTLVEAFAAVVGDGRAGRVARGQCLEQRGTPEPYLPVFDALQRLGRDDPEALRLLAALAPTWLAQLPSLVAEADRAALERAPSAAPRAGCCGRRPRPWRRSPGTGRCCCSGGPALGRPLDRRPARLAGQA
jgi:energy-coupling factor transporter ATP-binding protein EcfA2